MRSTLRTTLGIVVGLCVGAILHVALSFYDTGRIVSWRQLVLPAIGFVLSMFFWIWRQKRAGKTASNVD